MHHHPELSHSLLSGPGRALMGPPRLPLGKTLSSPRGLLRWRCSGNRHLQSLEDMTQDVRPPPGNPLGARGAPRQPDASQEPGRRPPPQPPAAGVASLRDPREEPEASDGGDPSEGRPVPDPRSHHRTSQGTGSEALWPRRPWPPRSPEISAETLLRSPSFAHGRRYGDTCAFAG